MLLEEFLDKDIAEIEELTPEGWNGIDKEFKFYLNNKSWCYPIKIVLDNKIVGIGCAITFGKTAWLGHIIVSSNYRKRGIGTFIVKSLCNYLEENGIETISLVATDLGYPVYKKLGFELEEKYLFFKQEKVSYKYESENIVNYSKKYENQIYQLYKLILGENRRNLIENYIEEFKLYIKDDELLGVYLPTFKDGNIIAKNPDAGIELMKLRNSEKTIAVLPASNTIGAQFLLDEGFKEIRKASRMVYGKKLDWKKEFMFNRAAGNIG